MFVSVCDAADHKLANMKEPVNHLETYNEQSHANSHMEQFEPCNLFIYVFILVVPN